MMRGLLLDRRIALRQGQVFAGERRLLAVHLKAQTTRHWLSILEPADYWFAPLLTWKELLAHEGYKALEMEQSVGRAGENRLATLRCPIRVDGKILTSEIGAPRIGEHSQAIMDELNAADHV